jgi:FkbM family methyltransferase
MYTYAQNFEDVMLRRVFAEFKTGFYIDVGAHDPDFLSVTKSFYDEGWSGINIEPIKSKWQLFNEVRPRDTNLRTAVGCGTGTVLLSNVVGQSALSSTDPSRIGELTTLFKDIVTEEVEITSLDSIIKKYVVKEIDFLKIDVEGAEFDVLNSLNLTVNRPKVLVIEAVRPTAEFPGWSQYDFSKHDNSEKWLPRLISHGYVEVHFDGLNKFFLREDMAHLRSRLTLPPGVFDFIVPSIANHFNQLLGAKEAVIQEQTKAIEGLHKTIQMKEALIQEKVTSAAMYLQNIAAKDESLRIKDSLIEPYKSIISSLQGNSETHNRVVASYKEELQQKENVIHSQSKALASFRLAYAPLNLFRRFKLWIYNKIRPRLGNLNQYSGRPITKPQSIKQIQSEDISLPKISIVTPSYGQGGFIERTLQSVLDQKYPNLEYFVQDGGSPDSTVTVLKAYESKLTGWTSVKDTGQSQAINRGFLKTDGEIMAWLNSDDLLLPGALNTVAHVFESHPEVDVIYGNRLLIDGNDLEIGRWIMPGHDGNVLSWADYIPQETMFWRRTIWEKTGGSIDESFRFAMDWDLIIRFRDAGACFKHIPEFLGAFRIHAHQKTSAAINEVGHEEMNKIRHRVLGRQPSTTEVRKAVLPFLVKHVGVDIAYRLKSMLKQRFPRS